MRARFRDEWIWWAAALLGVAAMSWAGLHGFAWTDYDLEASASFAALMRGDTAGFLQLAPAYGGSFVLRAPFAAITVALGGGETAVYRAVSVPGLVAGATLGVVLVRRVADRGGSRLVRALVLGLCVMNPITLRMLEIGHPEEMLAATLAIGAVLAAGSRRTLVAAVLLGLAIATKAWAVLAIGPVLLALPGSRLRALLISGTVVAAVMAPLMLAGSPVALARGATTTGPISTPFQLFWPLGESGHVILGTDGQPKPAGWRLPPQWLSSLTHPLIAFMVVPLSLLFWRLRRDAPEGRNEQTLGLLALLLLLRCVLDPWNSVYYELPFLLALLAWESLRRPERPPVLALCATAVVWLTFIELPNHVSPDVQSFLFLCWALPLTGWLAREVFAAGHAPGTERVGGEAGRRSYDCHTLGHRL